MSSSAMNPYVTDPADIPASDPYKDVVLYGRYSPKPDDLKINCGPIDSPYVADCDAYWRSLLAQCNETNRIRPPRPGRRDVFALGSVIIKSSHLHDPADTPATERGYRLGDMNERQARALARRLFGDNLEIPIIWGENTVDGRQVQAQQRLPGVTLDVAWPYLSREQKASFKQQARAIMQRMHIVKPPPCFTLRQHFVPDTKMYKRGRITRLEWRLLFGPNNQDPDRAFVHNNLMRSKIIVDNDKIIGIVGWDMAGYFGWETAAEIHRSIRCPQQTDIVDTELSEEELGDLMWWNDLYDEGPPPPGEDGAYNGIFALELLEKPKPA